MLQSSNSGGIVSRVQGVNKYYTFEICKGNKLRIGKMNNDYKIYKFFNWSNLVLFFN